jgi:uncharacterized protein
MKKLLKRIIKDFHVRWIPKYHQREIDVPTEVPKIITLVGPRRSGKTYMLFQTMDRLIRSGVSKEQILYLNFEDERIDLDGQYDRIFEAYLELYPNMNIEDVYLFFDEIQNLEDWERFVRRTYDTLTRTIYLTGSNSRMLSMEIATALRGRTLSIEVLPLSFREFLLFQGVDTEDRYSLKNSSLIKQNLQDYLEWGGYPEIVGLEPHYKMTILQEYFNVTLYRDIVERYDVSDVHILKYLMKRLLGSFTKEFSVNKIYYDLKSRNLSIGKDRLYQFVEYVESVYMIAILEKYAPSVLKREMSNKKIYLYSNGLATALVPAYGEDRGKLLENAVFFHLRRLNRNLSFLKNRFECDFILPEPGEKATAIQVTERLTEENVSREIGGLKKAMDHLDIPRGIVVVSEEIHKQIIKTLPSSIQVIQAAEWFLTDSV